MIEKDLKGTDRISAEQVENKKAVRKMLVQRGVQPSAEDVSAVKKRLHREDQQVLKEEKTRSKEKRNKFRTIMIHIVFQYNDVDALRSAFGLDPSFSGEVVQIRDDFAVGPISGIYSEEGIATRKQWWRDVLAGGDYDGWVDNGKITDDNSTVASIKERLQQDEKEVLWIWAAQNKHDVSGYYWLISQLKDFQGRVFILYLNNLPFINEKGQLFYPNNLFEIPPREFLKARKLARAVTPSEFEIDPDEWQKLCQEDKGVRILEGGKKLTQYPYGYYDEELRRFISGDWIKVSKLIGQFLGKAKQATGDAYLLWRIKQLVAVGELDIQGEPKGMRDFEIKAKAASPVGNTTTNPAE